MAGPAGALAAEEMIQGQQRLGLEGQRLSIDRYRADQEQQKIFQEVQEKNFGRIKDAGASIFETMKALGASANIDDPSAPMNQIINSWAVTASRAIKSMGGDTATVAAQAEAYRAMGRMPAKREFVGPDQTIFENNVAVGKTSPATPGPTNVSKLQSERDEAAKNGDTRRVRELTAAINQAGLANVDPALLTPTNKSKAQERTRESQELINNLGTVSDLLNKPGVTGASGALKGLINTTLAQFFPGMFSRNRAQFEQGVKTIREQAIKTVSSDDRFNAQDRAAVGALFPETGIMESEDNARVKIEVLSAITIRRYSEDLKKLNIDKASIPTMTPQKLFDAVQSGFLKASEAESAARALFTPEEMKKAMSGG